MSDTELPAGWVSVPLRDVAEVRLGRQRSPKNHSGDHMRPYLRAANVGWNGLKLDDVKEMNFTDDELEIYRLLPGDIVLSEASGSPGEVGKPGLWDGQIEDCCFQNTLLRVRAPHMNPRFLMHLLRYEALRGGFAQGARGVGIHHLGAAKLSAWPVKVPPLAEQQRIVELVEAYISRLDAASILLQKNLLRSRAFQDAVVQDILNSCDKFPREALGNLLREPLRNGHSARSSENSSGVRTLTLTAVTLNEFSERYTKVTVADPVKVKGLWLEPGDILIQRSNTPDLVGTAALYTGSKNWAIFPDLLIRVRTVKSLIPEFAALVLRSPKTRRYFKERAKGLSGSMPKIDQSTISSLAVPVPPVDVQRRLVAETYERLEQVDRLEAQLNVATRRSKALRSALLSGAFTGQLVPQDPSDEPASVLLERIRAERAAQPKPKRTRRAAPRKTSTPPAPEPTSAPRTSTQQELPL